MRRLTALMLLLAASSGVTFAFEAIASTPEVGWPSPVFPVTVSLATDTGESKSGAIVLRAANFTMRYPVDMPPNTTREILLPVPRQFSDYSLSFEGSGLPIQIAAPSPSWSMDVVLATVGDTPGTINVLIDEGDPEQLGPRTQVVHWGIGQVPLQAAILKEVEAIFLGDGADRLRDVEVRALRDYVLLGGNVVIPSGAPALVARDPRWADWLPATVGDPKTVPATEIGLAGTHSRTVTIRQLTPVEGAIQLRPHVYRRAYGLGTVTLLAADVFETDLRTDEKAADLFRLVGMRPLSREMTSDLIFSQQSGGSETFRVRPPGVWQIFGWLLAYIFIVGPLNFLVLAKLNRKEWAWFTAPLISVLFAGIVVSQSQVRRTSGVTREANVRLVTDPATGRALVYGQQLLFFPDGGTYDLNMKGVTSIWFDRRRDDNPWQSIAGNRGIFADGVTLGTEFDFTRMRAKSLAYEEFYFLQETERRVGIVASARRLGPGEFVVTAVNKGAEPITNVTVTVNGFTPVGRLDKDFVPGERVQVPIKVPETNRNRRNALVLTGDVKGVAGAQVGSGEVRIEYQTLVLVTGA